MKCPICGRLKVTIPHVWECMCGDLDYIEEIERLKPFEERSKEAIKYMNTNYKEFDSATYDIILKEILEGKQ